MGATPQIGKDADENKTFWRKPFIKYNKVNGKCFFKAKTIPKRFYISSFFVNETNLKSF